MELTFLGGADEIGASCAVLELDGERLLIDCGQRMGVSIGEALPDFSLLESGPPIAAVLLTHAHADHIGALPALEPYLAASCPIYATDPTIALTRVMLEDSLRIMAQHRQGEGEMPLFPPAHAQRVMARFQGVRWGKSQRLGDTEIWGTWFPAGHILGAAMIEIHSGQESVLFSGDVSVADQLTVPGVFAPAIKPHALILESTYGARYHAHRPSQEQRILDRVADAIAEGGKVLFPVFALGRAQEVLLLLGRGMREGKIPEIPVYADGLIRAVSKVYRRFPDELAPGRRKLWEQGLDPFFPEDLPIRPIKNNQHRENVAIGGPCVVVASSGMLQGGASQFYARSWIGDERNLILVTGYQDEESPGQALLNLADMPADQPRYFTLAGVRSLVRCQVESCQLSAHADHGELIALASKLQPKVVFPVHGDAEARSAIAKSLMAALHAEVILASTGETFSLDKFVVGPTRPATVRTNPLGLWPPWDPHASRSLELSRFHAWLAGLQPRVQWITIDELAELWKSPESVGPEDIAKVREAVYAEAQPYFLPDAKRPYILRVNPLENIASAEAATKRLDVPVAIRVVRELFPPESGLRRVGFFPEEGTVQLEFPFPKSARRGYLRRFGELAERSGWRALVNEQTQEDDLRDVLDQLLESESVGPSEVRHDAGEVRLLVLPGAPPFDVEDLTERFAQRTGYRLVIEGSPAPLPADS